MISLIKSSKVWSNVFDKEAFDYFTKELADLKEMVALGLFASVRDEQDFSNKIFSLTKDLQERKKILFLSNKYDKSSAVLTIQSGAGGRDAQDWAAMLLRMYQKFAELKNWRPQIISQHFGEAGGPEGRIGIKEAVLLIRGDYAYGILKKETGCHRLVRLSPFSAKQLRHTSFAQVEVSPKVDIDKDRGVCQFKPDDLQVDTFRSAGHGGQNVNKRETAVRITHLPTGLQASSQIERTQAMNKKIALDMLCSKIIQRRELAKVKDIQEEMSRVIVKTGQGKKRTADFGHQIRSYILHPYKMVKDHRTEYETSNTEKVLNGELQGFIEAEIRL